MEIEVLVLVGFVVGVRGVCFEFFVWFRRM